MCIRDSFESATVAYIVLMERGEFFKLRNTAPLYKYILILFSNLIATSSHYEVLKWVTLPTQTLAKCANIIPAMIWGTMMSGKYGPVQYGFAVFFSLGSALFLISDNITAKKASSEDSYYGLVLMVDYLGFDIFTRTSQEKLFPG